MRQQYINIQESSGWDTDKNGKRWEDYDTIKCPDGQIINMKQLLKDQSVAQAALVHLQPSFGGFVQKLRFIYTFKVKTQATDGYNIFVNPQFTANLDVTGKVFVMAHEIMHCLLNHLRRAKIAGHNDHMKSNIAADYECNATLSEYGGIGLIKSDTMKKLGAYIDQKYANMGYEQIYDIISQSPKDNMSNQDQSKEAEKNQQDNQQGNGDQNNNRTIYSDDYKAGWAQAIEDWKKNHSE